MNAANAVASLPRAGHGVFQTTHWSVVLAAADGHNPQAAAALEELCCAYWYPLYAFVRRQGRSSEDAQDLTQSFFARLLEKEYLAAVDPAKGRFRSFLLAAIKHFLADERDKAMAKKRGGGHPILAWDARTAEEHYRLEAAHEDSPERLYERRWALALLAAVFTRLEQHCATAGKREHFHVLQRFLAPGLDEAARPQVARACGNGPQSGLLARQPDARHRRPQRRHLALEPRVVWRPVCRAGTVNPPSASRFRRKPPILPRRNHPGVRQRRRSGALLACGAGAVKCARCTAPTL